MSSKAFIFIGRSGCGKGTQADLLMDYIHNTQKTDKVLHIETGAFLREFIKGKSFTQKLTKEVVDSGGLMPEAIVVGLWVDYLFKNYTGKEILIFDGCPRKLHETLLLDSALQFYRVHGPTVVYVNVSRKWAEERLKARARKDDTEEGVKKRMKWFEKDVVPTINHFRNNSYYNFLNINGEQPVEKVHEDIIGSLNLKSKS